MRALGKVARTAVYAVFCLIGAVFTGWVVNRFVSSMVAHPIAIGSDDWSTAVIDSISANPLWLDPAYMTYFWGAAVLFLIGMTMAKTSSDAKRRDREAKGQEHGSQRWAEVSEMQPYAADDFGDNIILSRQAALSIPALKRAGRLKSLLYQLFGKRTVGDRNKHVFICGGSGSGKTFNFVGPNMLQARYSLLSTDPKGDTVTKYGQFLLDNGYRLKIVNLKDNQSFDKSMHYNPFHYITGEASIMSLVTIIIENTEGDGEQSKEDFFIKAERSLYLCLIAYLYYEFDGYPEEQTIPKLLDLIGYAEASEQNEDAVSPLDIMMEDFQAELVERYGSEERAQRAPEWFVLTQYSGFKKAAGETAKSIIISCFVRLAPFAIGSLREMFSSDELELEKLGEEKTAFFLIMSDTDKTFNFILAMLLYQLFDVNTTLADKNPGSHCKIPVMCFLDEVANIGKIPDLDVKIATLRSRWINLVPIVQGLDDLDTLYGEKGAKRIRGNCDTMLFLGRCDPETNEKMSKQLGNETVLVESVSESKNGVSRTYTPTKKPLMEPEDLGSNPEKFADDECLVIIKNEHPFKDRKYMLYDHPNYAALEAAGEFDAERFVMEYRADEYRASRRAEAAERSQREARRHEYEALFEGVVALALG